MAYDPQQLFRSIYGNQYGLPQEYQNQLFQQGVSQINPQFAGMQKQGLSDLNQRGFNSAVPYSNMVSNLNTARGRTLYDLQNSITTQSMQAGEQQKGQLFGAANDYQTQVALMELQKRLGKKGFMDFLGMFLGQAGNVAAGWAGGGFKMGG